MSDRHVFYGVDLSRIKAIFGCGDERLLNEIVQARAKELEENDGYFEDEIERGKCPDSKRALRGIIFGLLEPTQEPALYGYVLKIVCEHLGTVIGREVADVQSHPYASQLVASGPPIPIPYNRFLAPQIGYLSLKEIPAEIRRIEEAPPRVARSFHKTILLPLLGFILSFGLKGFQFRQMSNAAAVEDMAAYRETLQEALSKGLAIVSFRH